MWDEECQNTRSDIKRFVYDTVLWKQPNYFVLFNGIVADTSGDEVEVLGCVIISCNVVFSGISICLFFS